MLVTTFVMVAWGAFWQGVAGEGEGGKVTGDGDSFKLFTSEELMKLNHEQLHQLRQKLGLARRQRYETGNEAEKVLKAHGATPLAKTYAALAIGELGHIPGILVLIEHIDLKNPVGLEGEMDIGSLWPCVRALADLGVAAVPALVKAYAAETEKDRRERLKQAIIFGKAYSEAKTYTEGLLSQAKDPVQRKSLEELLKFIPQEEKAKVEE